MTRRPNGTQWSDFVLVDPEPLQRFAQKPTAQPPVVGDVELHGYWSFFRGVIVAAVLCLVVVAVGVAALIVWSVTRG